MSLKKFLSFTLIAALLIAAFVLTPNEHRKKLLTPVEKLYNPDKSKAISDSDKVMVIPDNAQLQELNVHKDKKHPNQLIPESH
ncbi:unnamed protein product [Pichia kudriavzevii]